MTRFTIRATAEIAITVGLVLAVFVFYLLVWTNHRTAAAQDTLRDDFHAQQQSDDGGAQQKVTAPEAGDGFGILHIPALGKDWSWVVVEGVGDDDLARGPGHFPGTALPGKVGNFAVAGHRATHGEPFAHLDKLEEGDPVVVETVNGWLVYDVTWVRILCPNATEVLSPVAGHPGEKASQRTMTLVTCNPRWSSTERLVVGAQLVERRSATDGPPTALG